MEARDEMDAARIGYEQFWHSTVPTIPSNITSLGVANMSFDDFPFEFQNGLKYLSAEDAETFASRFSERQETQKKHMLIELVVAVFGKKCGYVPKFEPEFGDQRPDWLFTDKAGAPQFIAEVVTRHGDESIWGKTIGENSGRPIEDIWPFLNKANQLPELPDGIGRITKPIAEKANKYRKLVEQHNLPFVICLYSSPELFLYFGRIFSQLTGRKRYSVWRLVAFTGVKAETRTAGSAQPIPARERGVVYRLGSSSYASV